MTTRGRSQKRAVDLDVLLARMEEWPASWAGSAADESVGRALVLSLQPFITYLHEQKLSPKTVRRHLDNLWVIGGEIIRRLHNVPSLRKKSANELLLDAVAAGEAPLVQQLTEAEQATLDATARKLLRFLPGQDQRHT